MDGYRDSTPHHQNAAVSLYGRRTSVLQRCAAHRESGYPPLDTPIKTYIEEVGVPLEAPRRQLTRIRPLAGDEYSVSRMNCSGMKPASVASVSTSLRVKYRPLKSADVILLSLHGLSDECQPIRYKNLAVRPPKLSLNDSCGFQYRALKRNATPGFNTRCGCESGECRGYG